jgi:hypothetical protein
MKRDMQLVYQYAAWGPFSAAEKQRSSSTNKRKNGAATIDVYVNVNLAAVYNQRPPQMA